MAFIGANLLSVKEVVKHHTFLIPKYQRGYAWTEDQWRALWDDVENVARRAKAEHYGGSLMVSEKNPESNQVELVDGQQRMTSISLMLTSLGHRGFPIAFSENEALQTYFDFYALGNKHLAPSLNTRRSYYARNIAQAFAYFTRRADLLSLDDRNLLIDALLNKFKLFVLAIRPEFDVHVAFETINSRGRQLSTLERLKNRLIYLASQNGAPEASSEAILEVHRTWKQVYAWLGAGDALLDDDEFLRAHSLGWFQHERQSDWLTSKLFDETFSAFGQTDPEDIKTYVRSLEHAAACWYLINEPDALPPKVSKRLHALQKVPNATSRPLILWAMMRLAHKYPHIIEEHRKDSGWGAPLEELIYETERFGALVVLGNGRASTIGMVDMNRSAHALAQPHTALYDQHPELMPPEDDKKAVHFAAAHIRSLIANTAPSSDEDGAFLDPQFPWPGHFSSETMQQVVADRFRKRHGFYNWQFGKLIIYAWEEFLRGSHGKPAKTRSWEKFAWDESVEHIYPQTPGDLWKNSFSIDGRSSKVGRDAITNSIGNLLLLSRSRNASASNEPYLATADRKGKRARYGDGSFSEVQVAQICTKWTALQVAARGIAMFRRAQVVWNFEVVGEEQKLIDWLPFLFGDQADRVKRGDFSHDQPISNAQLRSWVQRFEGRS